MTEFCWCCQDFHSDPEDWIEESIELLEGTQRIGEIKVTESNEFVDVPMLAIVAFLKDFDLTDQAIMNGKMVLPLIEVQHNSDSWISSWLGMRVMLDLKAPTGLHVSRQDLNEKLSALKVAADMLEQALRKAGLGKVLDVISVSLSKTLEKSGIGQGQNQCQN